jgi:hypothetical protein
MSLAGEFSAMAAFAIAVRHSSGKDGINGRAATHDRRARRQ